MSTVRGITNKIVMEMWRDEVNKRGGLLGRPVEVIVEDNRGETAANVAAHKKLVTEDKVVLVLTELTSWTLAVMDSAAELYNEYPHLQIATLQNSIVTNEKLLSDYNKYKFFFVANDGTLDTYQRYCESAKYFMTKCGYSKMALLIENMEWTRPYTQGLPKYGLKPLKEAFEEMGMKVVYYALTDIQEKVFFPLFDAIAASGAEFIFWVEQNMDTLTIVKQWATSAAKDIDLFLDGGAVTNYKFWEQTGGACLGVITAGPDVDYIKVTGGEPEFIKKLRDTGYGITMAAYHVYNALLAFEAAVKKAGTLDADKLIQALLEIEINGLLGKIKFKSPPAPDAHRVAVGYPYYIVYLGQWREDGNCKAVWPEEVATIPFVPVKSLRK